MINKNIFKKQTSNPQKFSSKNLHQKVSEQFKQSKKNGFIKSKFLNFKHKSRSLPKNNYRLSSAINLNLKNKNNNNIRIFSNENIKFNNINEDLNFNNSKEKNNSLNNNQLSKTIKNNYISPKKNYSTKNIEQIKEKDYAEFILNNVQPINLDDFRNDANNIDKNLDFSEKNKKISEDLLNNINAVNIKSNKKKILINENNLKNSTFNLNDKKESKNFFNLRKLK